MSDSELDARFQAARAFALEAGDLARRLFETRTAGAFELKGAQDYLTEADGQVERLLGERIAAQFPGDAMLGEEGGGRISSSVWIVDPIDGTANFARGIPYFSVSIAYVRDGQPLAGAIYNPMVGELFAARRGGGATLNDRPIRVSSTAAMNRATIELGWSTRRPLSDYADIVRRVMATGAGMLRQGSGALGMAYVAAGRIDGYAELHINSWDVLAGMLLVQEAGGWTNDFLANDGLSRGNPILGCAPGLRAPLSEATGIG